MNTFEEAVTAARECKAKISELEAMKSKIEEKLSEARASLAAAEDTAATRLSEISDNLAAYRQELQRALQAINDAPVNPQDAEPLAKAAEEEFGTVETKADDYIRIFNEGESFNA
jgi:type VI protein secretion system component VasK